MALVNGLLFFDRVAVRSCSENLWERLIVYLGPLRLHRNRPPRVKTLLHILRHVIGDKKNPSPLLRSIYKRIRAAKGKGSADGHAKRWLRRCVTYGQFVSNLESIGLPIICAITPSTAARLRR
jgi:hypothetical protein